MAEKFDFTVDSRADEDVLIDYQPGRVPYPLTGYTIVAHLRRNISDASPAFTLSTAGGTITIAGSAIMLKFKAADFSGLSGRYYYDVHASTTVPSVSRRIVEGQVTVNPATTRT